MCTLIVLNRAHREYPVVIAANRDEFYARPATAPQVLRERPRVVAGLDRERAGTWMGVTDTGLFVGVTNQRTGAPADRSLRSRGEVVLSALSTGDLGEARALLESLDAREYNPFNVLFGTSEGLFVAYARAGAAALEIDEVPEGVHVLPNDRLDAADWPKVGLATKAASALVSEPWRSLAPGLAAILRNHDMPPEGWELPAPRESWLGPGISRLLQAVCIHTPVYGTRSATLAALAPGRTAHYLFAPGPPCTHAFEDLTSRVHPPATTEEP